MSQKLKRIAGGALTCIAIAAPGCAHPKPKPVVPQAPVGHAPDWVKQLPKEKGVICALGAVDPTFYKQDGVVHAAERARAELARNVEVHIWAYMKDVVTTRGQSTQSYVGSEVDSAVTDGVVAGAEVRSSWYDQYGLVSRAGMTYALACMRTDESAARLAEKLRQAKPDEMDEKTVEKVKERAQSLFDQLEAMEDAKRGS